VQVQRTTGIESALALNDVDDDLTSLTNPHPTAAG
jgi:hypothetical protein